MLAIDWGTSSFRAYRLGADGAVREKREAPLGILQIENRDFVSALESQIGDWAAAGETPIVMSGMIGSRQGWAEAQFQLGNMHAYGLAAVPADQDPARIAAQWYFEAARHGSYGETPTALAGNDDLRLLADAAFAGSVEEVSVRRVA